ncbi:PREDICTED: uncharacterized protein LOC106789951 [Polistes canadensis]|uniref:uncharacterized protein LOC106789951 n=1 Tax=Polistes canadensis TaxID=91411 RepID=UPI000718E42A|nr:PREDICTED: uncharacterized protein LOC106789951 [Polistes canadensis]
MSKKRSAKTTVTSVKSKKLNDENAWQEPLESIAINDDHWWCVVTMMIETKSNHARFVSMFNEAADEGKRKSIYTINRQKMLANVWSLSRQDPDKCPILQRVCHHANKLLEANIESTWLLARVIKYMIYQAKVDAVLRIKKEQELKRAIEDEYRIMQTILDPSTSKSIQKKSNRDQSLKGKANTRLRIREEEWRDIIYVDDAPHDGPNLYVILTGFHDPDLPLELMNIGVPLTCILKIKRPGEKLEHVSLHYRKEENRDTVYDRMRLRFPEIYTVDKVDLYKFWSSLKNILKNSQTVEVFSNVAFLTLKPPILFETSDDLEYETLKKDIYDKVSFIVYDLYDLLRKHSNYLRSMLIQRYDIDEMKEVKANVYHAILDALPTECVTVPILLHALLLQVEDNLNVLTDRSLQEQNVTAKENIYEKYKVNTNKNVVEEKFNDLTIELILNGDKLSLNTHHITLDDNIKGMLKLSNGMTLADAFLQIYHDPRIIDCWLNHEKLTDNKMREYDCYINNLINYFDPSVEICQENICHYLHFLIFDKMIYGDSSGEKTDEKDQMFDTDIDYGKPVAAFLNCPDLFGLTDKREILLPSYLEKNVFEKRRRRMHRLREPLEEYNDVELLPKKILLQTTYECFQDFEHFEKRYFKPTDSILLYFSNDYVVGDVSEKLIVSNLRTPVCLRDFIKYVKKEEIDWINREEEKYRLESIKGINSYWENLEFDFHASWPSGLTILPVTGDGPDNPFYIRQSYISKGPKDVSREAYRKYLRNGTVLKFLHDNSVIVLRSNGVVVECISFEDTITEETNLEEGIVLLVRWEYADARTGMQYGRIKVTGYNVLDHDGRRYEVLRDLIVREYDRLLFRANSDYEVDENFTRRSDGTDMLFRSNGKLIVHFPDGTRITTGYKIEERPLICDWTRDEFERYFGSIKLYEHDDRLFEVNSGNNNSNNDGDGMGDIIDNNNNNNNNKNKNNDNNNDNEKFLWHDGEPLNGEDRYHDEMRRILIADGFVSVLLTSLFEHKNYASVSYDQSAVSCTLSMPTDLRVSISRRGHYEVSAPGKVNLKIKSDKLIFSSEMCATCAGRSTSVYNFNGRRSEPIPSTIFTSNDLFGNVFEVKSDGTTSYRGKSREERPPRKFDFNENAPDDDVLVLVATSKRDYQEYQEDEDEERNRKEEEKLGPRKHCNVERMNDHGKYCQEHKITFSKRDVVRRYRILSINRDLNAYEYLHRSIRHREEMIVHLNKDASSAILPPVSIHRSNLHHLITFVPLETELRSKALLQSHQIPKVKPTNADRRDLVRSTYSIPYDWLFPFGRNGHGICNDTYDMPLAKTTKRRPPRTLRLRILHGFKEPDRNAIIDLQKAMASYWRYLVDNIDECQRSFYVYDDVQPKLVEDDYRTWKDNIREFALGIRTNIDVTTYHDSLQRCRRKGEWDSTRVA